MENVMKPAKQLELFSIHMGRHAVCASYTTGLGSHSCAPPMRYQTTPKHHTLISFQFLNPSFLIWQPDLVEIAGDCRIVSYRTPTPSTEHRAHCHAHPGHTHS
eukprot:6925250-Prymnesium_polylepis.1